MSFSFSDFENPEGRMIGGKNYIFGENEEAAIRRWEEENGGKKAYEMVRFNLTVDVQLVAANGSVIRREFVPLSRFSRLGFASFPIPLHNLNRLMDLPRSRFHWFHPDKEPNADFHVEDGYAKIWFKGLTKTEMDDLQDVKCTLLDKKDMDEIERKAQAEREAAVRKAQAEREAAVRKAQAEREAAVRKAQAERVAEERKAQPERVAEERKAQPERVAEERKCVQKYGAVFSSLLNEVGLVRALNAIHECEKKHGDAKSVLDSIDEYIVQQINDCGFDFKERDAWIKAKKSVEKVKSGQ